MNTDTCEAWLIHKQWQGETSAYITLFTREKGLLRCLYKGGRTLKKQPLLQPFTPLWVGLNTKNDWHYINTIEILSPSLPLESHALFAGWYINELLINLLYTADPQSLLYDVYSACLQAFVDYKDKSTLEATLRKFEWALLTSAGYEVLFSHDIQGKPVEAHLYYQYNAPNGFQSTLQGIPGKYLLALASKNYTDKEVLKVAKWVMRKALDNALEGKVIKARELYK